MNYNKFYKRMIKEVEEKNEAMRLNIELYTMILEEDRQKKAKRDKELKGVKGKKNKREIKRKYKDVLGQLEVDQLNNNVEQWSTAIIQNKKMLDLLNSKVKRGLF